MAYIANLECVEHSMLVIDKGSEKWAHAPKRWEHMVKPVPEEISISSSTRNGPTK